MFFVKLIFFIILLALGFFFLIKTERIVNFVGHNSMAERYLGSGGSYTMWRGLGVIAIIIGFLLIIGKLDGILGIS